MRHPSRIYSGYGADAPTQTIPGGIVITQRPDGGWYTPEGIRVVQVAGGAWVFDPSQIPSGGEPGGPIVGTSLPAPGAPASPSTPSSTETAPSPGPTTQAIAIAAVIGIALGYAYGGGLK